MKAVSITAFPAEKTKVGRHLYCSSIELSRGSNQYPNTIFLMTSRNFEKTETVKHP